MVTGKPGRQGIAVLFQYVFLALLVAPVVVIRTHRLEQFNLRQRFLNIAVGFAQGFKMVFQPFKILLHIGFFQHLCADELIEVAQYFQADSLVEKALGFFAAHAKNCAQPRTVFARPIKQLNHFAVAMFGVLLPKPFFPFALRIKIAEVGLYRQVFVRNKKTLT